MLKKRWPKALLLIFLAWFMISIYFYFQHRVAVTIIDIPGWEIDVNNNKTVQIKQIRIYDWERKDGILGINDKLRSVFQLGNTIPNDKLKGKYFDIVGKIIYFYSDPYKKLDGIKRIDVSGVLISSEHFNSKYSNENWPEIQISVNQMPVYVGSSSTERSGNSNITLFTEKGYIQNTDQEIESIELKYNAKPDIENSDLQIKSVKVSKEDKRNYSFLNHAPHEFSFLNLDTPVYEFIRKLPDEKQQAEQMISDKIVDFPWHNMPWPEEQRDLSRIYFTAKNYLGDYKTFNNVFVVDVAYTFRNEENHDQPVEEDHADAAQSFYVVEQNEQWKIIDVSPLGTPGVNGRDQKEL